MSGRTFENANLHVKLRDQHYADQARIALLERQLATAISVALDRDQRLAYVDQLANEMVCACDDDGGCSVMGDNKHGCGLYAIQRVARGQEIE